MLRRCWLALIAVSFLSPAALARESIAPESSPQTTWREVLTQFRQSARLAQNGKLAEAQSLLEKLSESVRAPYAQHTKVLLSALPRAFADHSEALRYRMYQERASAAERLGEYEVAMIWTRRASELLEPSARGNDLEHIVWLLAATRTEGDAPGSIKAQLEFIQGHFLEGAPNANKPDRLFAGLERLTPLLEQTNDAAERRQIHGQIQACLLALGDADGLTAWEDQMLGEVWVSLEDRAGVAIQRGDRAYKMKNYAQAEKQWRLICDQYPHTSHYGVAQFNLGYLIQEQGKLKEAIAEYHKLFASQVDDQDPGSNIMEAYRNYRNRAAKQISQCHDKLERPREALEWAIQARDKYRYQSWCGTCSEQEAAATAATLVRLKHKAGDTAEALRDAEALVFGKEHYVRAVHVPRMLAEEYFAQGRVQELLDRIDKLCRENLDKRAEEGRRANPERPFDGHTDATRLIVNYVAMLRLAEKKDLAGIWKWIQNSQVSAQEALLPAEMSEATVGLAAAQLTKDRAAAIDFLKGRFRTGNDAERGWAAVLLAKLGEVKNIEALHRHAAAVPPGTSADEQRWASKIQTDFFYAALIAEPDAGRRMVDRYMQTDLTYAAQNAYHRERNMTLLPNE